MEPKFVNYVEYTKETLQEAFFNTIGKPLVVWGSIILPITILLLITSRDFSLTTVLLLVIAVTSIFMGIYMPRITAKQEYERNKINSSGEAPSKITFSFFDDCIKSNEQPINVDTTYNYSQIQKIKSTKNLYILQFNKSIFIITSKNSFTTGTAEEFEAFMKEKIKK